MLSFVNDIIIDDIDDQGNFHGILKTILLYQQKEIQKILQK